jgi:hypothetical protein
MATAKSYKHRSPWTPDETEALMEYMAQYPRQYATILKVDAASDNPRLQNRNQINLKDKARTMAEQCIL